MPRVLTLAYHFPPIGGAGVMRMKQIARRLPARGWEQVVITGPGTPDSHWRPRDEPGEADAQVLRIAGPEPPHDVRWEARLGRWLHIRSRWTRWWATSVVDEARALGTDVDLVHASLAPYSTADSAVAVARRLGRPLVVDLEDPWALDEMLVYPTGLHRELETRRMGRILSAADHVVMNTPEARRRVLVAFPNLAPDRVGAIRNAFDPDDFAGVPVREVDPRVLRIVHTGSLHTAAGLEHRAASRFRRLRGGAAPGIDFLTRSHLFLLEAVERVLRAEPELAGRIEVHLAGVFTPEDRAVARRHAFVRLHEFLPHRETVSLLRSADLLFLPMHDLPPGRRAGLVPQKTYEYVAAGPPILAAVPDGDARDLLAASGVARLCRPADTAALAGAVAAEAQCKLAGGKRPQPDPAVVASCSAERLTDELVAIFERVAGHAAPVPA